jgi:hypothetical protein
MLIGASEFLSKIPIGISAYKRDEGILIMQSKTEKTTRCDEREKKKILKFRQINEWDEIKAEKH